MNHGYEVVLSFDKDVKNWLDASRNPIFQGVQWKDYLRGQDLDFFEYIIELPEAAAKREIEFFLRQKYTNSAELFVERQKEINKRIDDGFELACEWLKDTTRKPLHTKKYKIFLTTFPRSPYDVEEGVFYMNIYQRDGIMNTFMHEVLHFQFTYYWKNNLMLRMPEEDFEILKEALTVIIDEDAVPPADYAEKGYIKRHDDLRAALHEEWRKGHDFEKTIEIGVNYLKKIKR